MTTMQLGKLLEDAQMSRAGMNSGVDIFGTKFVDMEVGGALCHRLRFPDLQSLKPYTGPCTPHHALPSVEHAGSVSAVAVAGAHLASHRAQMLEQRRSASSASQ